jgi:hypothetical protein
MKGSFVVYSRNCQISRGQSMEDSLKCTDCHAPRGRLDFAALGYSADRAATPGSLAAPRVPETGGAMLGDAPATHLGVAI